MARRSDHSREELRELILTTAEHIITEHGFAALTIRNIMSQVGYTVGTLYHLFEHLDDVIMCINSRTLDRLYDVLQQASGEASERLYRMGEGYIRFSADNFSLWSMLFEYRQPEGGVLPEGYMQKITAIFALIEEEVQQAGVHDSVEAARAARILWAGMHGIATLSLGGKLGRVGAESAQTLAQCFLRNFMAGLLTNPAN